MSKHIHNPIIDEIQEQFFEVIDASGDLDRDIVKQLFRTIRSNVTKRFYIPLQSPFEVEVPPITDEELLNE